MGNWIYKLLISFIGGVMLTLSVLFVSCNTDDYNETPIIDKEPDNDYESGSKDGTDNNDSIEGEDLLLNGGFEKWSSINSSVFICCLFYGVFP